MKLPVTIALLAGLGILTGCETVTSEGYRQRMDLSLGQTPEQVTADHGQPDNIAILSDGRELWIYDRHRDAVGGGGTYSFTQSRTTDSFSYKDKNGKNKTSTSTSTDTVSLPLDSYTFDAACQTRFVFGLDKRVQRVTFDGNDCRALEARKGATS